MDKSVKIDISFSESIECSEVNMPGIHDAEIYGVELNPIRKPSDIHFKIINSLDRKLVLKCLRFSVYQINGMHHQNVISEINVYKGKDPSAVLDNFSLEWDKDAAKKYSKMVADGRLCLVHIVPSFGAEVHVFCDSFELYMEE